MFKAIDRNRVDSIQWKSIPTDKVTIEKNAETHL